MKYKIGQEVPITINSMFEQGKLINTIVVVRKIVGNIVFVQISMEYGTYQNLYGTEEQLENLIRSRNKSRILLEDIYETFYLWATRKTGTWRTLGR